MGRSGGGRFIRPVHADTHGLPDWRDDAAYAAPPAADRALFAWEWLRRDRAYRQAWDRVRDGAVRNGADAALFGLARFEDPRRGVPDARPIWLASACAAVLDAIALAETGETFDSRCLGRLATIVERGDREHLLVSDGFRYLRLDGPAQTFSDGPRLLRFTIDGIASARPPLLTLRRFVALCASGRFAASLHPRETRARRWTLMLRVLDALGAGASQRDIASQLLRPGGAGARWRSEDPSLRSRVQRLVRSARAMAAGGYRGLLR